MYAYNLYNGIYVFIYCYIAVYIYIFDYYSVCFDL